LPAYGPTANEIKAQLKTLLTPVIGTSLTYKTLILDYMAMAFKPGDQEDPTVLRSDLDTATLASGEIIKRVNCLMITEDGFGQAPAQKDATRLETRGRGKNIVTRGFLLSTFYQFGIVAGAPSENVHSTINEAIRRTLNDNPKLGFAVVGAAGIAGPGAFIDGHNGLQNPDPAPDALGGVVCHVSVMPLTVRVIEALG
jgi:hypothetical protein